jgi:hypothetical protein
MPRCLRYSSNSACKTDRRETAASQVIASSSLSLRLAAPRFRRRSSNSDGYPRQSLFRSSITRLSHSLSTLRSFPSRALAVVPPRTTRFRLVANLCRAGPRPRKIPNEVSSTWLPPQPSFRSAINVRVRQHVPSPSITRQQTLALLTSASRVETANCNHVIVGGRPNIGIVQRHHCARLAGCSEELHVEAALGIDVNHRADIARAQSVLRDITSKNDLLV